MKAQYQHGTESNNKTKSGLYACRPCKTADFYTNEEIVINRLISDHEPISRIVNGNNVIGYEIEYIPKYLNDYPDALDEDRLK